MGPRGAAPYENGVMGARICIAGLALLMACEAPIRGTLALEPETIADAAIEIGDAEASRPDADSTDGRVQGDARVMDVGSIDAGTPPPIDAGPTCGDGVCAQGESCPIDCDPGDWPAAQAAAEAEMLVRVNVLRAEGVSCGGNAMPPVPPVEMNAELREAARAHSQDMADQNYFDHQSLDGRDPWTRIRNAGYGGQGVGENIAAGNASADATFSQWVNSPGHCRNMMSAQPNELGVGYAVGPGRYRHYWTQAFGRR